MLAILSDLITLLTPVAAIVVLFWTGSGSIPASILAIYVCLVMTGLLILLVKQETRHQDLLRHQRERHQDQLREQETRHHSQLIDQEIRSGRSVHYAPAMIPLRKAFGCLANASWTMVEGDGSEESFSQHLRDALQLLAEVFSLVTDKPCRVTIKMTSAPVEGTHIHDVRVYTLCRSYEDETVETHTYDRIGNNTDFRMIFEDNAAYFLCNDLPAQLGKGYQNSHWDQKTIQSGSFKYRATIVWPISRARPLGAESYQRREVIGFLCVDTLATNAFNETFDVPIGAAFCQGLHLALNRFRAKQMESQNSLPRSTTVNR